MSSELTVVLENVQYPTHLRKDEYTRPLGFHRFQKFVENHHFTGIVNQMFVGGERWTGFLQLVSVDTG